MSKRPEPLKLPKSKKRPCMSRKNPELTHGLLYSAEGWGLYAENLLLLQVPIEMIRSGFFIASEFSLFEKCGSEGNVPYTSV